MYVTCHGIYRASMNGEWIDNREFAPEYTSYDKYLCYQTYDVTSFLKSGKNVLGMYVADGWYFCTITTMNKKTAKENHAVLYELRVTYTDGENEIFKFN